ncbi:MAG: ribosomal RNA small subunit methyltransferase A [Treponema sp.]|nr:ribosomal RNA small subunit methyltransferase A [Treponema sp.]
MQHPDYDSPNALKDFMEQSGLAMQKKFGQNFMVTRSAREKIVSVLGAQKDNCVWEVGPGLGSMTELLLKTGAQVTAFEIDKGFIQLLPQFFDKETEACDFKLVAGDVLKTWHKEAQLLDKSKQFFLFGNLPYNIAATFIADTITKGFVFDKCVFTIQKEVALRMAAQPSTPNYSAFSVLCQKEYSVKNFLELPPAAFWPRPQVASEAVLLTRRDPPLPCKDPAFFVRMVHALFASRRKTIANNIKAVLPPAVDADAVFDACGISKTQRAENLTVEQFLLLSQTAQSAMIAHGGQQSGN